MRILCLLSLMGFSNAFAEGTSELGETQRMSPSTALSVDILFTGETITWSGQHPIQIWGPGSNPNTDAPLATLNSGGTLSTGGTGVGTYQVRLTGSQQQGNIGYETDWDLAVPQATGGRVWSRAWQLDANSFSEANEFNGSFYARVDGGGNELEAVVEFRAEGLAGFIWFVAANDFGIRNQDGRSYDWPSTTNPGVNVTTQHPIYLLPPEDASYITADPLVTADDFFVDAECDGVSPGIISGEFRFNTDLNKTWHITCDLNNDGAFDITTDDDVHLLISSQTDARVLSDPNEQDRRVRWDGLNNAGEPVPPGSYECQVLVTVGEFHYVASDVETAYPGIRLFQLDEFGGRTGLPMFWNDGEVEYRNAPMGNALDFDPENPVLPLNFSGPEGIDSGNDSDAFDPNVNARSWGSFREASKGNTSYLDTYTFVDSAVSLNFDVVVLDPLLDSDLDTLSDLDEECFHGTNPNVQDTDDDGLRDDVEVRDLPTDPLVDDTDGDGIADGEEVGDPSNPTNTDDDALIDALDPDDDGDGIPTVDETGQGDTDDDELPNYLDPDDDGDGIPTEDESGDTDNDDIDNYLDADDDGDGLNTEFETEFGDTDGDDLPDYLDDDDDNDGIPTVDEDLNGNGDYFDDNSDGDSLPDYRDPDDDDDGIPTAVEGTGDPDGDDIPAYLDDDSDGDSILDVVEGTGDTDGDSIPDFLDADDDGDGIPTAEEAPRGNTDGDNEPDYLDEDDDGDGIPTLVEGDGNPDGDDLPNYLDEDSDGDGLSDSFETAVDTDGDNTGDYLDTDSDDDGVGDETEGRTDTDGDLIPDFRDTDDDGDSVPTADEPGDTDEDGTDDYLDTDDDDDGIPTLEEAAWTDSDVDGDDVPNWRDLDSDGDALSDEEEGTVDTDDDGVPDYLDPDGAYGTYYKGGCTLDHTRGLSFGWLALLLPLVVRRRRTQ